jgi:hypothetical protein
MAKVVATGVTEACVNEPDLDRRIKPTNVLRSWLKPAEGRCELKTTGLVRF